MKKLFIWGLVLSPILFWSCGSSSDGRNENVLTYESIEVERQTSIVNDPDAPKCVVKLNIDVASDNQGERAKLVNATIAHELFRYEGLTLSEAADSFANKYTSDYVKNFAPLYREDDDDAAKHAWYEYHYVVKTETREGRKGVSVYLITLDYYEGGAHGLNQQLVLNFDTHTGRRVMLDDLFVAGYKERLCERLEQKLMDKTHTRNVDELNAEGYLIAAKMSPSQNFIIDKDGISFIYNVYEIAPYYKGLTELYIPYDELKDIMK